MIVDLPRDEIDRRQFSAEFRMARNYFYLCFLFLFLVALTGFLQYAIKLPFPKFITPAQYYTSLTLHGVLGLIGMPLLFIMGFGIYVLVNEMRTGFLSHKFALFNLGLSAAGGIVITLAILSGEANLLFTFFPPMAGSIFFYLGAALLVLSVYTYSAHLFLSIRRGLKIQGLKFNAVSSGILGLTVALLLFLIPGLGLITEVVMILGWILGWIEKIDPLLSRNLFWLFGHAFVYSLLLPVAVGWYTLIIPKILKTEVYSKRMTRIIFALFLIYGIPVGIHHQLVDPGMSIGIKYFSGHFLTFLVMVPSFMHAFNVTATMEQAGRAAGGGTGLLSWILFLPWGNPVFTGSVLGMLAFVVGGATGAVNGGFQTNLIVRNSTWLPAHFHLTAATTVVLSFMAFSYYLIPLVTGKRLVGRVLALWQSWIWFLGVTIFSFALFAGGLLGIPRRTYDIAYDGNLEILKGIPGFLGHLSAGTGGTLMVISVLLFLGVIIATLRSKEPVS